MPSSSPEELKVDASDGFARMMMEIRARKQ